MRLTLKWHIVESPPDGWIHGALLQMRCGENPADENPMVGYQITVFPYDHALLSKVWKTPDGYTESEECPNTEQTLTEAMYEAERHHGNGVWSEVPAKRRVGAMRRTSY